MKTTTLHLAFALLVGTAVAQESPGEKGNHPLGPPPGHHPPPPVILALDTNKDGALSAEEIKAAPEALLKLDKNGDGELSIQELSPQGPPPPPPQGDGPDGEP